MAPAIRQALVRQIAIRAGTAGQIARQFDTTVGELKTFVNQNRAAIQAEKERIDRAESDPAALTPQNLEDLWITNKFERLKRLQTVAGNTYDALTENGSNLSPAELATVTREFRSYLMLAANELGQLLHRGSGDSGTGDTLSIDIQGVDMESLR